MDMGPTGRFWGILGFHTDDARIRDAFEWAEKMGVEYEFVIDEETKTDHPNTADMDITGVNGYRLSVRGESIGAARSRLSGSTESMWSSQVNTAH